MLSYAKQGRQKLRTLLHIQDWFQCSHVILKISSKKKHIPSRMLYFFKAYHLLTPLSSLSIFTSVPSMLNYFCPLSFCLCFSLLFHPLSPFCPSIFTHLPLLLGSACLCLLHSLRSFPSIFIKSLKVGILNYRQLKSPWGWLLTFAAWLRLWWSHSPTSAVTFLQVGMFLCVSERICKIINFRCSVWGPAALQRKKSLSLHLFWLDLSISDSLLLLLSLLFQKLRLYTG